MANLFLDFTNGNDGNDGTTFANRFRTITNGATAARIAPPDVVRIMKSEDPVSLGINATFTNKSDTVTLASALTQTIHDCNASWTAASANVTMTTSTTRKEGATSVSFAIAAGFTTGQIAYSTLASTDYSTKQKITFWLRPNATVAAGVLQLTLCSDTLGATPVDTFTINEAFTANLWKCITIDKGSACGAAIQSVSFNALSDPGTVTILLDNIEAALHLTLTSLISMDSSATSLNFWAIKSISGTTIKLDQGTEHGAASTARGWSGTTATATCYKREPIRIVTAQTFQEAGSVGSPITYSGGWDTTDMTTQTGLTFIDLGEATGAYMLGVGSLGNLSFEKIVCVRASYGWGGSSNSNDNLTFTDCGGIDCSPFILQSYGISNIYYSGCYSIQQAAASWYVGGISKLSNCVALSSAANGFSVGFSSAGARAFMTNVTANNNSSAGIEAYGSILTGNNITAKDNGTTGILTTSGAYSGFIEFYGVTTSGNTSNGVRVNDNGIIRLHNTACTDSTPFYSGTTLCRLEVSNVDGVASDSRTYEGGSNTPSIETETSSGRFWEKLTPGADHTANFPLIQRIQSIPVAASGTVTIRVIVKRSSTNIAARLIARGGQSTSVTTDQTADAAAAINTEETLTLSFAPGQAVPFEVELHSWRVSGSGIARFANFTATQA
jgi:hypothetical protein